MAQFHYQTAQIGFGNSLPWHATSFHSGLSSAQQPTAHVFAPISFPAHRRPGNEEHILLALALDIARISIQFIQIKISRWYYNLVSST